MAGQNLKAGLLDAVWGAIGDLDKYDRELVEMGVSERSVTHKLAEHLRPRVNELLGVREGMKPQVSVDCEYNKYGKEGEAKQYLWRRELPDLEDEEYYTPNPDIVVHERGKQQNNLLVIEAKADTSRNPAAVLLDLMKVVGYVGNPTFYQLGLYLDLTLQHGQITAQTAWLLEPEQMEKDTTLKGAVWAKARALLVRSGKYNRTALAELNKEVKDHAAALLPEFRGIFGFEAITSR